MKPVVDEPWDFFGISFAPLKVPLQRRLETLAMTFVIFLYFVSGVLGILTLLYLWISPTYRFIAAIYTAWMIIDNRFICGDSRLRSEWVRNWAVWRYAMSYFPIKLHKSADLDPKQSYLLGYHPHGVMPNGASLGLGLNPEVAKLFPGMMPTICSIDFLMWVPFHREILIMMGVRGVNRDSVRRLLRIPGNLTVIIVGGAAESLEGEPGRYRLILRKRKGFIREALLAGTSLVPVFSFGEIDAFPIIKTEPGSLGRMIQEVIKSAVGYTIPFIKGRGIFQYSFGILPHRLPMNVVVGRPIAVQQASNPSRIQIDELHKTYVDELTRLFEENKARFQPSATLEIR